MAGDIIHLADLNFDTLQTYCGRPNRKSRAKILVSYRIEEVDCRECLNEDLRRSIENSVREAQHRRNIPCRRKGARK
jgi:hypothetical protein